MPAPNSTRHCKIDITCCASFPQLSEYLIPRPVVWASGAACRKMISQIASKYLRITARNVHFWGSARFDFDTEENRVIVPKSAWRKSLGIFNCILHTSYAVFVVMRLLQYRLLVKNGMDKETKVFLEFACLVHLVPPLCTFPYFIGREEAFAAFVNQYLSFYEKIDGKRSRVNFWTLFCFKKVPWKVFFRLEIQVLQITKLWKKYVRTFSGSSCH